ncbi:MAG: hypothetical protein IK073_06850 [Paludibacteraceae bacterium]|nr:hypothetical protein [Paludibacteraceae bacterium]
MKKNYIAPSTELATWASMGLMQGPSIGLGVTSGAGGGSTPSTDIPGDVD